MNTEVKLKTCAAPACQNQFRPYFSTDRYCSARCALANRKKPGKGKFPKNNKPIKRRSKKGAALDREYERIRRDFLGQPDNRFCPVTCGKTTEVHHKMGREGYADDWARENNIPLLVDVRFFLAVSHTGHKQIEANPDWAYKMGYSLLRTVTRHGKAV